MPGPDDPTVTRRLDAGSHPRAEPLRRGSLVGRYVVLSELGEGGMGTVYAAYDPRLDRKVALKLLHAQAAAYFPGGEASARMEREAQALARLSHPNIVAVHDVAVHDGRVFIAMELVDGVTLREWLEGRPLKDVLRALGEAGRGLAAIHSAGLVHRDFKASNVMVARDGRVKVLDLGLARLSDEPEHVPAAGVAPGAGAPAPSTSQLSTPLTQLDVISGTPGYLAPELLAPKGVATASTDQFAFGVVLYQALYGDFPYGGATFEECAKAFEGGVPLRLPRGATAPRWLFPIVQRALALHPEERYPTMPALLDALAADPAAARRRALGLAALALAMGGLAAAGAWAATTSCPTQTELLATTWPPGAYTRFEGLLASASPDAGSQLGRGLALLDRRVREWAHATEAVCREGASGQPQALRRAACLERTGQEFRVLTEVLSQRDPLVALKCADVIGVFTEDPACRHRLDRLSPDDVAPHQVPLARELRAALFRGKAFEVLDRYAEGAALNLTIAAQARDAGLYGFEGEALFRAAYLEYWQGLEEESTADYRRALHASLAAGVDERALWSAARLSRRLASQAARLPEARQMLQLTEALLVRSGSAPDLELEVLDARAAVARAEGRLEALLPLAERALLLSRSEYGEYSLAHAFAWGDFSAVLYELGRVGECPAADLRAIDLFESVGGLSESALVFPYRAAGEHLHAVGRSEEAVRWLDRALELAVRVVGPDSTDVADVQSALAWVRLEARPDEALRLAQAVVSHYEGTSAKADRADAFRLRAHALAALGRGAEALADCDAAATLAAGLADPAAEHAREREICRARALGALGRSGEAAAAWERAHAITPPAKLPGERADVAFELARAVRASGGPAVRVRELCDEALAHLGFLPGFASRRERVEAFRDER